MSAPSKTKHVFEFSHWGNEGIVLYLGKYGTFLNDKAQKYNKWLGTTSWQKLL